MRGARALLAAVLACGAPTIGAPLVQAQEEVAVTGEIVDLTCYLAKGSKGPQHRSCAQMCAKKGLPIGVLTESGDVYLLIDNHDDPEPYEALKKLAGQQAAVKGKKFSKGGMASIMVTEATGR